ncbi:uncharacterized protein si:ch211-51h9.7 [Gambusia affinis]|uniref:uncharacterized protein si:ch211-51h9.7 n=1 Tax=Gambusia affinis TaxID=33528 RepID=UPI001CDBBE1D|nr:uncharacterized protein si:ch211-51h9.7 [Gambusia affinis]
MRSTSRLLLGVQWDNFFHFIVFVLLFFHPSHSCAADPPEHGTSTDTLILCRACGHEVAFGTDIHFVPSRMALSSRNDTSVGGRRIHIQLFENPQGLQFEVIVFKKADVIKHWPANSHFSWYPGFSWTVATCPRCKTHLGWGFQPNSWPETVTNNRFQESENTFLALIAHRILREDFASSLLMTPKSFTS